MDAGSIWVRLGLDTTDLQAGVTGASIQFDAVRMAAGLAFSDMQQGFEDTIGAAMNFEQEMNHLSEITGMSTDDAQKWRDVGIDMGVSAQTTTQIFTIMTEKLGESSTAGDNLRKRLSDLGVAVYDSNGNMRDSSAIMLDLLPKMSEMTNAHDRDNLALALLGKNWKDYIAVIDNGTQAAKNYNEDKPDFSKEDLQSIDDFRIAWGKLNNEFEIAKARVGLDLIPIFDSLSETLSETYTRLYGVGLAFEGLEQLATTGNAATFDEAVKRMEDPYAYQKKNASPPLKDNGGPDPSQNTTDNTPGRTSTIGPAMSGGGSGGGGSGTAKASGGWDTGATGTPGSEMSIFMANEALMGTDYQQALTNWANGTPTKGATAAGNSVGSPNTSAFANLTPGTVNVKVQMTPAPGSTVGSLKQSGTGQGTM